MFSEILVIIVVAIVVLRPKDFAIIMEKVGLQINIFKRFANALLKGFNE